MCFSQFLSVSLRFLHDQMTSTSCYFLPVVLLTRLSVCLSVCRSVCLSAKFIIHVHVKFIIDSPPGTEIFSLSPCGPISFPGLTLRRYSLGYLSEYFNLPHLNHLVCLSVYRLDMSSYLLAYQIFDQYISTCYRVCLSVYLSVCLSVRLSVCLFCLNSGSK